MSSAALVATIEPLSPEYAERAERYLNRLGPANAIILARFIAIVRTVLNPPMGIVGVLTAGYLVARRLGASVDPSTVDRYGLPLIALIIVALLIPVAVEIVKVRRSAGHR